MGQREGPIEKHLVDRVKALGGEIRKTCWIGRRGCPDRFAMLPFWVQQHIAAQLAHHDRPRNPWVECKGPGQALDAHQEREIERMRRFGELVLVLDCKAEIDRYFPPPN
jgi:hypothetical protein